MKKLARQDTPPRPGPNLPLIRIKSAEPKAFIILGSGIRGQWTHWNGKASEPCYEPKEECNGCRRGLPRRWKGYIHVYTVAEKKEGFVEVTPTAADILKHFLPADASYRGECIMLNRSSNSEKGRLKCSVHAPYANVASLPAERDPLETLAKLWKLDSDVDDEGGTPLKIHGGTPSDTPRPTGSQAAAV